MKKYLFVLLVLLIGLTGCYSGKSSAYGGSRRKGSAPTGKYRNPTIFSRANPFQGRAKARLTKSKKKKIKLIKKKHKQADRYRKAPKPGRTFGMKRSVSRGRLKSSGSRMKKGGGGGKKNKNLFNTRK